MSDRKILVADKLGPSGLAVLDQAPDVSYDVRTGLTKSELLEVIGEYSAVIVRSATNIDQDVIEAGDNLLVIGRAGVGVDNIDVGAATRRGVVVTNTPQANSIATAEQTMALMLATARHTAHAHGAVADGIWERSRYTGVELADKTLGIIGFGRIGREVARRARAFAMDVIAFDPYVTEQAARDQNVTLVELETLLRRSDFVTLHCALSTATENLIDEAAIAMMKPDAILINAARGGLIDEPALAAALGEGRLRGAGIDVYSKEPPANGHPLIGLPNVVHTPHLGASTTEAQSDVAEQVVSQVLDALRGDGIRNSVNFPFRMDKDTAPWLELATAMGKVQFAMAPSRIERIEIEARGDGVSDNIRAVATGVLAGVMSGFLPDSVNLVNAPALAADHGIAVSQSEGIGSLDYPNMISCRVFWDGGDRAVSGVVFGGIEGRIVQVSKYQLDAKPRGLVLLMLNNDVPGVIGEVGTLLGTHKVNIAEWRLGRDEVGGRALSFINLDNRPGDHVMAELRALPAVEKAMVVEL
ncbi:MAG: phosphoglycerate dehydrogenase [Acidimicrobiia bacterium]|nr:phosphoglycerate dehydrogenase [Acidimicrobiia bacterium]